MRMCQSNSSQGGRYDLHCLLDQRPQLPDLRLRPRLHPCSPHPNNMFNTQHRLLRPARRLHLPLRTLLRYMHLICGLHQLLGYFFQHQRHLRVYLPRVPDQHWSPLLLGLRNYNQRVRHLPTFKRNC